MAKGNANTGEKHVAGPIEKKKEAESTYTALEFAEAAGTGMFEADVTQDIITAAFFVAGKQEATKAEALEIVKSFLKGDKK